MSAKNLFLIIFLGSFVLSAVVMVVAIQTYKDSQDYQGGFEFSSSTRGVNYEVFLPSKDDPAGFCVIEGRNDNMLIIALDYFYITQDDQSIYGVAVDNSRFEIQQELSGCWTIVRETNDLRVRLVNLSNSDIFFETKDTKLEEVYTERYEKVRSTLDTLVILTAVLFASLTTTALLTVFFPEEF